MSKSLAELQAKIEELLERYIPVRSFPYFDRHELTTKLLLAAHIHAMETVRETADKLFATLSMPVAVFTEPLLDDDKES